ncbi:MAG: hypothetical protein PVI86_10575 [Phycisphaerae bacterium]
MNKKRLRMLGLMCCVVATFSLTHVVQGAPDAICVPWVSGDPSIAHYSYDGAEVRLKGIVRGEATEFRWDFGDGGGTAWAPIGDPYSLEAAHAYTGTVGQVFLATLNVRDGGGEEDQCTYRVRLYESSDLGDPNHLDVRVNMAVDEGLWWVHTTMVRADYAPGPPGYEQPYGYWTDPGYPLPASCTALDAFEVHGSRTNGDYDGDPYVETVQRALNYLLYNTYAFDISAGQGPDGLYDADTNGNGIGLVTNHSSDLGDPRQTYIGGICMTALASSGAPNVVAAVGGDHVYDRPFAEIAQDMVDFFAWGQCDSGNYRGGWRYYANSGDADMSTTQWPVLGMLAAELKQPCGMGSTVPQFVRDELPYFLNRTRHNACDAYYGGYGYSNNSNYVNCLKAATGIIGWEWLGTSDSDPKITGALGYLYRHWNDDGGSWQNQPLHGNGYGMYAVMKAMRIPVPDLEIIEHNDPPSNCDDQPTGNTLDWYYATGSGPPQGAAQAYSGEGLAHYAVRNQHADGHWDDTTGIGENAQTGAFSTGWQILTLLPEVVCNVPGALICHCDDLNADDGGVFWDQDIPLDGSCSYHPAAPYRTIVSWDWDFDNDGEYDDASGEDVVIVGGFPSTGYYPVTLRVTDDDPDAPQTDTHTCLINVHPPPHCPIPDAGGPYNGWVGTPTNLDACASWDPNDNIATYEWDLDNDGEFDDCTSIHPECMCDWTCPGPGEWAIGVRVCDDGGGFDVCCLVDYTELDCNNHPPVCDLSSLYEPSAFTTITLDGCDSYDLDPGDDVAYAWDLDGDGEYDDGAECNAEFTVGDVGNRYFPCLKVTDSFGEYCIACTIVEVRPNVPPECDEASPSPGTLWAPNREFVDINIIGVTDADGDTITITIDSIYQDEQVVQAGSGSGNTSPDGIGVGSATASVRAERNGNRKIPGDGRVYHIGFTADDGNGGTCTGTVQVCVPHDRRTPATCVDGGPLYDSTQDGNGSRDTMRSSRPDRG